jgi:hypothetical protein
MGVKTSRAVARSRQWKNVALPFIATDLGLSPIGTVYVLNA